MEVCNAQTISACMIVRDEADCIERCLKSVENYVDEVVMVDTGCKDDTMELAKVSSNGKLRDFKYKWNDSFADARNFSISKATSDWIFIIDADEQVKSNDWNTLLALLPKIEQDAIAVDVCSLFGEKKQPRSIVPSIRFFRRSYKPEYTGRVHNRPVIRNGAKVYRVPFKIFHYGYDLEPQKMKLKRFRIEQMCKKYTEDEPWSPIAWYYLGKSYRFNPESKIGKAIKAYEQAVALSNGSNDSQNVYLQSLAQLAACYYQIGNNRAALYNAKKALAIKPDYLDAIYVGAMAYVYGIDALEGEHWLRRYLDLQETYQFSDKLDCISYEYFNDRIQAYAALIDVEKWKNNQQSISIVGEKNGNNTKNGL